VRREPLSQNPAKWRPQDFLPTTGLPGTKGAEVFLLKANAST